MQRAQSSERVRSLRGRGTNRISRTGESGERDLELSEKIDGKPRYTKQDIEAMMLFTCKAYGNQFTVEDLKDAEKGLDAAGIIMEFQFIDVGVAEELERRMEKMEKNFQSGK